MKSKLNLIQFLASAALLIGMCTNSYAQPINSFPHTESFDQLPWASGSGSTNSGFAIDSSWTFGPFPSSSATIFSWMPRTGSTVSSNTGPSSDYSGSGNYLFVESSYGSMDDSASVTSTTFDLSSLNAPELSFQYHMYGTSTGTLMVWAWNGTSYDTVWTLNGNQGNSWNEAIVDLSNYKTANTHLVFHAIRAFTYFGDMAIDEVSIHEAPACPKPTQVTLDSITPTTATVNVTAAGHEFIVEYGPTGFVQGAGTTINMPDSSHVITGLTPDTEYDFYVRNDCADSSNGTSAWVGPFTTRTICSYINYYFTDWDQIGHSQSDFCWTFLQFGSTIGYASAYNPSSTAPLQAVSDDNYYRFNNATATAAFLISPEFTDLDQNTLQIRFQATDTYAGTSGTPLLYVGTMSSLSDTATFVVTDTVETMENSWAEYTVLFDNVPANHRYIAFRHSINAAAATVIFDDLYVEPIPSCVPPSLGNISHITDTSLVIDWTAGDGNTFEIQYGVEGFTLGSGTTISGLTNTYDSINGLTPNVCYEFYLRGNCTSDNSAWHGPLSACTDCSIFTAPYMEDFEDPSWVVGNISSPINGCWDRTSTSTFHWLTNSGATTSSNTGPATDASGMGKYVYTESSTGAYASHAILETPTINFSSLSAPALSFSYHMFGATTGKLYVLVSNGAQYDTIHFYDGAQQNSSTDPWETVYFDVSAYSNMPRTFRFVGVKGTSSTGDMAIDEISIDEMPSCLAPTDFSLDSVAASVADFSWTSLSNGVAFKMEWGPIGFKQASAVGTTAYFSTSPATVTGLSPKTNYDIYVADMCDSTNWVGPINFTTVVNDDAELQSLISPSNLVCGDSSQVIEVLVINNGLNNITNLPVHANITGAITASITNTYTDTIAPGTSAIITVGTVNVYHGGLINVEAFTSLSADQIIANDTLVSNLEIISAEPVLLPFTALCPSDSAGQFVAMAQTGITHNWYQNQNDATPFATGDTMDVLPNQTLFLDRSKEADQLVVDAPHTSSQFGNMFKLYVKNDFTFTGFSFVAASSGTVEPIAFYKQGNFVGHETTRSDWTAIDSLEITGASANNWYRLNFTTPVQFSAGDTISFYLANKQSTKIRWENLTSLNAVGDLFFSNADFEYYAGVTGAYFGNNMTSGAPRAVSSIMHYTSNNVCGNNRIAVTMDVNNDTAMASFTHSLNANGADVDFDATASTGQVYEWSFGDGSNGVGENTTHTYTGAGSYIVTLAVTDTICGTTDTISETVLATVSLNELALGKNISVYPNPNNGAFKVDLNLNGGHDLQLVLLNALGQIVYNKELGYIKDRTETEVSIDNLSPGIYYLNVLAQGKSTTVKVSVL